MFWLRVSHKFTRMRNVIEWAVWEGAEKEIRCDIVMDAAAISKLPRMTWLIFGIALSPFGLLTYTLLHSQCTLAIALTQPRFLGLIMPRNPLGLTTTKAWHWLNHALSLRLRPSLCPLPEALLTFLKNCIPNLLGKMSTLSYTIFWLYVSWDYKYFSFRKIK